MLFEIRSLELRFGRLGVFEIVQPPLPCGRRDLARDIAVGRVAGQDDLGAAPVAQGLVQNAWIMVMKEPKPRQPVGLDPHLIDQHGWINLSLCHIDPKQIELIRVANEMWIERLAITMQPRYFVQVFL